MKPPKVVPQRPLVHAFGLQRSGCSRTVRREPSWRVASVRQDPNSAAPGVRFQKCWIAVRCRGEARELFF
jgi:hypothetical protein